MTQFALIFVTAYLTGRVIYEAKSFKDDMKHVDSTLIVHFNKNQR